MCYYSDFQCLHRRQKRDEVPKPRHFSKQIMGLETKKIVLYKLFIYLELSHYRFINQ